jgi:predicted AlkP superfamily pyrophosphatase or phosphodiesterase
LHNNNNNNFAKKSKYVVVLDVVGLDVSHLSSGAVPSIAELAKEGESGYLHPVFPSVTCTVQSSILTGKYPDEHGIISNGMYDKQNLQVQFWEQSSNLVERDRIWDSLNKDNNSNNDGNGVNTAILFWQNTMYANCDYVITPRPIHKENGQMDMWCYSRPPGFYEEVAGSIGEFDLSSYWGPFASLKSSEWITNSVEYVLENKKPNLLFAYFPQLDYSAQKFGKESGQVKDDIKRVDSFVQRIVNKTKEIGIFDQTNFIVFSEYGFNNVNEGLSLNRLLREKDLLNVRTIKDKEYIDFEYSAAFAMVDHQVAHVYVNDQDKIGKIKRVLEDANGVDIVCGPKEKENLRINNPRSGDLIAVSSLDKWFSYYWWHEEDKAPTFTKTVDIHRKPGYDPLELFIDMGKKAISVDTSLIKGSHGRPANPVTGEGLSAFVSSKGFGKLGESTSYMAEERDGRIQQHKGYPIHSCTDLFHLIQQSFS